MTPEAPNEDDGGAGSKERPVVVDTNALMMQFQYYLELESELQRVMPGAFRVVVPQAAIDELEQLVERNEGKQAEEARLAIELAGTFEVVASEKAGDEAVIELASKLDDAVVVTNDKLLRARLRAKGIPNVHMRSKAFLSVEGFPGV